MFTCINFILAKDSQIKSNKGKKKHIKTNYNLWIGEKFEELCNIFIETVKRNNTRKGVSNDNDLDTETFNSKALENNLELAKNYDYFRISLVIICCASRHVTGMRTKAEGYSF